MKVKLMNNLKQNLVHMPILKFENSVSALEDATDVVQEAASRVETNVAEGIQPDMRELRIYMSELSESINVRLKRMLWAFWAILGMNLLLLAGVFLS